jgi:hypothetical protein
LITCAMQNRARYIQARDKRDTYAIYTHNWHHEETASQFWFGAYIGFLTSARVMAGI